MILKQSNIWGRKFLMVLSSDHRTGATGKTVSVKLSKGSGGSGSAAAGAISELDSTNLPGWYQVALTIVDTNTQGDLEYTCTASGCDTTTFVDQVQTTVFADLRLNNGRADINLSLIENVPFAGFDFLMTNSVTGVPQPGLTVASQVSIAGAAFVASHNSPTEISNGIYTNSYVAADLNGNMIMARYTAPGANDLNVGIIPTP